MKNSQRKCIRLPQELDKRIKEYIDRESLENESEFYRRAAVKLITPDTSDTLLTFESLKDLHNKMHRMDSELSTFFNFFCFFVKHFFVYNPEIPASSLSAAALSAKNRYEEMLKEFQKSLSSNPSVFESILADFFEDSES